MNKLKLKKVFLAVLLINVVFFAHAFEKGPVLGVNANFSGSVTLPSIPLEDLHKLNPLATNMGGFISPMLLGSQVNVGYIFDAQDWFPSLSDDSVLSGFGIHGYLGFGQGNTSQKITAQVAPGGDSFDIFMIVNFLPTINFGAEFEVLMFENRFSVGLGLGSRAIVDMSPSYLVYSTKPDVVGTEVGEIIINPDMMLKMNAFALTAKLDLAYHVPILPTTELVLGVFGQFNAYKPKYLTVPPSLLEMATTGMTDAEKEQFNKDINSPFPNYWLNSLDFGLTVGLMFAL